MSLRLRTLFLVGVSTAMLSTAASAQSDVVVMRRVLAPPTRKPPPSTPLTPGDPGYYSWQVSSWQDQGSCGTVGPQTRTVSCVRTDGTVFPDVSCTGNGSGQKPQASRTALLTGSCSYSWQTTAWSAPTTTCGSSTITRDAVCLRSDQSVVDGVYCPRPAPATTSVDHEISGCGFVWQTSQWGSPSVSCGSGVQTRTISCLRTDGTTVASSNCSGEAPATTQNVYTACDGTGTGSGSAPTGLSWKTGEWGAAVPACGATVEQRTVACEDDTGAAYADSLCAGQKPAATQPATSYATCTDGRTDANPYGWTVGDWSKPTGCGSVTISRSVACTDGTGAAVEDSKCTADKPVATSTTNTTASCSYAWYTGDFGDIQPGCGATYRTRTVYCRRSDGTGSNPSNCYGPEPSSTSPATDYSACAFGWSAGEWSVPSSTCGAGTETRTVSCLRTDGQAASDDQCAGEKPAASQATYDTSTCGVSWKTGDWKPAPACGETTATRDVTCLRSDGQTVDDSQCAPIGAKPPTTQDSTDYSTCSYHWSVSEYPAPSTSCGTSTQTRSVTCIRSDDKAVTDDQCVSGGAGDKPGTSETTTQTTTCTYSWNPEAWGATAPACGPSTHSRTIDCLRSDGTVVGSSFCSGQTNPYPTSETVNDYSTCTYKWAADSWNGTAGCGDSVTQTRSVYCLRSDGGHVADNLCGDASTKPAASQPITDYSQCSYSWQVSHGQWSGGTCSATATRSNTVTCVRQDGSVMTDQGFCDTSTRPADTDTGNYSSCTYTGTYGTPLGTCSPTTSGSTQGTQGTTLASCKRSDGTDVTSENVSKSYSECAKASTQACTVVYTGTYTNWGACTPTAQGATTGTETGTISKCTAPDGSVVSNSYCPAGTSTRSCSGITYAETYGNYGTCTSGNQTAAIATCTTTSSDGVSGTVDTGLCPAAAQTANHTCNAGVVCGSEVGSRTIANSTSFTKVGTYGSLEEARQACQNFGTVAGVCYIENSPSTSWNAYYANSASVTSSTNTWTYAAACSPATATKTCSTSWTAGKWAGNPRKDLQFMAASSIAAVEAQAVQVCQADNTYPAGTASLCTISNGYSPAVCTNRGITIPNGASCWGIDTSPVQTLTTTTGTATTTCQ